MQIWLQVGSSVAPCVWAVRGACPQPQMGKPWTLAVPGVQTTTRKHQPEPREVLVPERSRDCHAPIKSYILDKFVLDSQKELIKSHVDVFVSDKVVNGKCVAQDLVHAVVECRGVIVNSQIRQCTQL
ncbi:unnamed protein product [Prorocentrum cordatum]|uniref:Uncharacterized protein n=1 Tax=Prorocentrum cordatum TaxID=2364126 RepID=A0ABN9YFT2_9DINO|nr:unnamed protein product [Polarella glacialis]